MRSTSRHQSVSTPMGRRTEKKPFANVEQTPLKQRANTKKKAGAAWVLTVEGTGPTQPAADTARRQTANRLLEQWQIPIAARDAFLSDPANVSRFHRVFGGKTPVVQVQDTPEGWVVGVDTALAMQPAKRVTAAKISALNKRLSAACGGVLPDGACRDILNEARQTLKAASAQATPEATAYRRERAKTALQRQVSAPGNARANVNPQIKMAAPREKKTALPLEKKTQSAVTRPVKKAPKEVKASTTVATGAEKGFEIRVNQWLFEGAKDPAFPMSKLRGRNAAAYAPKKAFSEVPMLGQGRYSGRIGVHQGGITDLAVGRGEAIRAGIADTNNGDLLTGCGFKVAEAIINAAGPGLQAHLYGKYGIPRVMGVPEFGKLNYAETEGRGYSLTCEPFDMKTHGISAIEFMTVPVKSLDGLRNMYREAMEHSQDLDYIAIPLAGTTHKQLFGGDYAAGVAIAVDVAKAFVDTHPESRLKIVFVTTREEVAAYYRDAVARYE